MMTLGVLQQARSSGSLSDRTSSVDTGTPPRASASGGFLIVPRVGSQGTPPFDSAQDDVGGNAQDDVGGNAQDDVLAGLRAVSYLCLTAPMCDSSSLFDSAQNEVGCAKGEKQACLRRAETPDTTPLKRCRQFVY